ncbi:MAG: hypothetical protein AUH81_02995 [Candidatus Rokubacteria bacterium 13_1_40CM_4_69_5]|nr:MAG: hypothetical protein AUH81_02995 [Candidatus Rokubacteria bacterium 13_1_40CM_4_69_5]
MSWKALARLAPDLGTKLGVTCRQQHLGGQVVDVARPEQEAGLAVFDHLARPGDIAGHQDAGAGLRFEVDPCLGFGFGWHDHDIGEIDVLRDALVIHPPSEPELLGDAVLPAGVLHGPRYGPSPTITYRSLGFCPRARSAEFTMSSGRFATVKFDR